MDTPPVFSDLLLHLGDHRQEAAAAIERLVRGDGVERAAHPSLSIVLLHATAQPEVVRVEADAIDGGGVLRRLLLLQPGQLLGGVAEQLLRVLLEDGHPGAAGGVGDGHTEHQAPLEGGPGAVALGAVVHAVARLVGHLLQAAGLTGAALVQVVAVAARRRNGPIDAGVGVGAASASGVSVGGVAFHQSRRNLADEAVAGVHLAAAGGAAAAGVAQAGEVGRRPLAGEPVLQDGPLRHLRLQFDGSGGRGGERLALEVANDGALQGDHLARVGGEAGGRLVPEGDPRLGEAAVHQAELPLGQLLAGLLAGDQLRLADGANDADHVDHRAGGQIFHVSQRDKFEAKLGNGAALPTGALLYRLDDAEVVQRHLVVGIERAEALVGRLHRPFRDEVHLAPFNQVVELVRLGVEGGDAQFAGLVDGVKVEELSAALGVAVRLKRGLACHSNANHPGVVEGRQDVHRTDVLGVQLASGRACCCGNLAITWFTLG